MCFSLTRRTVRLRALFFCHTVTLTFFSLHTGLMGGGRGGGGAGAFGTQVLTQLIGLMEDAKYAKTVVVFAGYQPDMERLIDTNQGIASRVDPSNRWELEDWNGEDCCLLIEKQLRKDKFRATDATMFDKTLPSALDVDVREAILAGFVKLKKRSNFGNGASVLFVSLCFICSTEDDMLII